jgi:hypothetical protein
MLRTAIALIAALVLDVQDVARRGRSLATEPRGRRRDQPVHRRIIWRTKVDGNRADHKAISPDGTRLLVSASTAKVVDVLGDHPRRMGMGKVRAGLLGTKKPVRRRRAG